MSEKALFMPLSADENYQKYLVELKEYYRLKHDYNAEREKIKKSINLVKFARIKFKCINCERVGDNREGTIFKETGAIFKATCGRIADPCDLKIEIVRLPNSEVYRELSLVMSVISDIKKKIIMTKLDFLFSYIQEDKAVELFDGYKAELSPAQSRLNELLTIYNNITSNKDIDDKIKERHELITKYKECIELYKTTPENRFLKDALEIYMSGKEDDSAITIRNLDKTIRELKYVDNFIDYGKLLNDTIITRERKADVLVQNKYAFRNMELAMTGKSV